MRARDEEREGNEIRPIDERLTIRSDFFAFFK